MVFTHSNLERFAAVLSLPVENQADEIYPSHTRSHAELRKRFCHKRREAFTHHLLFITLTGRRIWLSVLYTFGRLKKMSHVQMTPILASTRSVFFQQYNFDFDPLATLYGEFRHMAKGRKWRQGSNSKKFEKAWNQCFGPDIPVGYDIDKRAFPVGAHIATDDAVSSLMRSVQSLSLEGRSNGNRRAERANLDFTSYYGSDADITEKWQTLCHDYGIDPVPTSIKQCKKVQPLPLKLESPSVVPADASISFIRL